MNYIDLVRMFPNDVKEHILSRNMIALAGSNEEYLRYLFDVWYLYIEPQGEKKWECPLCRQNVLKYYIELQPIIIEEQKQQKLLHAL